jgi:hypothetical protein
MTPPRGLRRFVTPDAAPAERPSAQSRSAAPGPPGTTAAESTTRAAPDVLPPALADLLESTPGPPAPDPHAPAELCEFCKTELAADHGHVADLEASSLACACRACYLLFTQPKAGRGRYRSVPDRYAADPARPLSPGQWERLEVPVGLAFFFYSSRAERMVGFYPSPAGATECVLDLAAWQELTSACPLLGALEPDVEAALISRGEAGVEYFLVPIDACYELAGRMRLHWRGFDGGAEAKASIAEFLDMVRSRATPGVGGPQPGAGP